MAILVVWLCRFWLSSCVCSRLCASVCVCSRLCASARVCVRLCASARVCVRLCASARVCVHLLASVCVCVRLCASARVCVRLFASVCICSRLCASVCVCSRLCASVCVCSRLCASYLASVVLSRVCLWMLAGTGSFYASACVGRLVSRRSSYLASACECLRELAHFMRLASFKEFKGGGTGSGFCYLSRVILSPCPLSYNVPMLKYPFHHLIYIFYHPMPIMPLY